MIKVYCEKSGAVDPALLEADKLSYAVVTQVLKGTVKKIITDHRRILIVHTAAVYPTWIWAPDDVTERELEIIYQQIKREFAPIKEYRFNTKYKIADYLMKRFVQEDGEDFQILANIAAYECLCPKAPVKQVEGALERIKKEDAELAARLIMEASAAIGDRILSQEESREAAKEQLERQCLYIWRDGQGTPVAFCDRNEDQNYTKVSQVYTIPEARSKGYAGRMIYEICLDIRSRGQIPMLYADADYAPSNRCYQNIGFVRKGSIATIGIKK